MTLDQLLKLLSAARFPLAIAVCGLVLNFGGSNNFLKNSGLNVALIATGTAAAVATKKNSQLAEISQLQTRHDRQTAALKESVQSALSDSIKAQQSLQARVAESNQMKAERSRLDNTIAALKTERDRVTAEVLDLSQLANQMSADLNVCHSDKSILAGQLETTNEQLMQLIYELYETAVTEADLNGAIAGLETQFKNDSAYQLTQKKRLKSEVTMARADFHTRITDAETATVEAQNRIAELESALAAKVKIASEMIGDLTTDANGKFTHFAGKDSAQTEVINGLRSQIDEQRKTIKAQQFVRFDIVGTDNIFANRLIDSLAKHGSVYGAHHHEREGHNGRLKVWLKMIDAPLKRAQDSLDDMEGELKLWAKPSVKVDKGMHLFTLATEQEHKVLEAPNVPLARLEKTLDSAIHARIVGGSGSGKTVLLNNLMHYLAASMKGANVTLLDPKAVDEWGSFTPRYWGKECVEGIVTLADSLEWRVADTVQHRKAGKPAPKYDTELFVLDEAQHNYLLAQNADTSHVKERGEQPPNYAKKASGALAGLLSLGRAYDAIGLFVTQLPQVSKVGLNIGSFDPCVNIFLGSQIDNAFDSFLPGSGFTDAKCKALARELDTRRQLGQKWIMLVADLPKTEAYLMECPNEDYYHTRVSRDLGVSAQSAGTAENAQSPTVSYIETCSLSAGDLLPASELQAIGSSPASTKTPSAHCPECSHVSIKYHGTQPQKSGKYRFICENPGCGKGAKKGTFSASPLA